MKSLFRSAAVQGALTFLLWAYLDLVLKTVRWRRIDEAKVVDALAQDGPAIGCFWHGCIALGIAAKPVVRRRETRILISMSPDGEFVSRAMQRHDMPSIRGSSGKSSDRTKGKGGAAAFRESLDWLQSGGVLVVTPDGPRGPYRKMAPGTVRLARRTQAPVFFMGLAARPAIPLKSWDRMRLPLPFGKGALVWAGPFIAPPGGDDAALERLRQDWEAGLTAACERAEAALSEP